MKNLLVAASLLTLSACASTNELIKPTHDLTGDVGVNVKLYISPPAVDKYCGSRANGCAWVNPEKTQCYIWLDEAPQRVNDEFTTIAGHEIWHCFKGSYHEVSRKPFNTIKLR